MEFVGSSQQYTELSVAPRSDVGWGCSRQEVFERPGAAKVDVLILRRDTCGFLQRVMIRPSNWSSSYTFALCESHLANCLMLHIYIVLQCRSVCVRKCLRNEKALDSVAKERN